VAGRRNDGLRVTEPWTGASRDVRTDEERLTSLFRGSGEAVRLPNMGAVEPSREKAIEPCEPVTDGDSGAGLVFRLECCELDMVERRLIHEARRVGTWLAVSASGMSWSLELGAKLFTLPGSWRCSAASLVILLTMRRGGRPS
jgi:hypothetical protein